MSLFLPPRRRFRRRGLSLPLFWRRPPVLGRRSTLRTWATWLIFLTSLCLAGLALFGQRPAMEADPVIAVWNAQAASLHEFPLEQYVQGVVAAEMPPTFHLEALKAQAVAARTYALRRIEGEGPQEELAGAHVSSDFRVHQAWIDEAAFVAQRPGVGAEQWERIAQAVEATRGLVLTYEGEPAETLYHSTSGGHTESAAAYFAGGQPYLAALPDPYGDHSPTHRTRATVPLAELFAKLGAVPQLDADVRVAARTPAGRAAEVVVGSARFTGREVREALSLRSSWFDAAVVGDEVVFDVRGNGHGVGMSQYGADGMARAGHAFEEILAYYYPGTVLERWY